MKGEKMGNYKWTECDRDPPPKCCRVLAGAFLGDDIEATFMSGQFVSDTEFIDMDGKHHEVRMDRRWSWYRDGTLRDGQTSGSV